MASQQVVSPTFSHPLVIIERLIELIGRGIAWLTLAMVLLSFAIVVLRYGFNLGWVAMQESVLYLHGVVFMLGAAYTLQADGHVRVDIFYQRFSVKQQALVNLIGGLLLLLPVCCFIFYISFDYVMASWSIMEKSSEAGGLPLVYLNKSLILLMSASLFLQALAHISRDLCLLRAKPNKSKSTNTEVTGKEAS
ncbi:TRAP transporter small permease subunit [Endozoicomonas sp. G2_1]|uniref:TRAP transporter small permease subunit n=1 Tax=Endozoicomonas sp. G2_1 TaxID=2821091 RepID=UPI0032AEADD9